MKNHYTVFTSKTVSADWVGASLKKGQVQAFRRDLFFSIFEKWKIKPCCAILKAYFPRQQIKPATHFFVNDQSISLPFVYALYNDFLNNRLLAKPERYFRYGAQHES